MAQDLVYLSNVVKKNMGWCPGCGHALFQKLIMECIDELGYTDNCISVPGVGCTGLIHGMTESESYWPVPHGRPGAVATGVKRVNPDTLVYTWQGDGDAFTIGFSETMNAAYRNENFCMFVSVNNYFAMTGGQMSWNTLEGQKTVTSPQGRDCDITGKPLHVAEMMANEFNIAYAARGTVNSLKHINQLKKMIKNAMLSQINGEGFSIVECLSMCPTSWVRSGLECRKIIEEQVIPEYPIGVIKERRCNS